MALPEPGGGLGRRQGGGRCQVTTKGRDLGPKLQDPEPRLRQPAGAQLAPSNWPVIELVLSLSPSWLTACRSAETASGAVRTHEMASASASSATQPSPKKPGTCR
jgi:hypothetical protein